MARNRSTLQPPDREGIHGTPVPAAAPVAVWGGVECTLNRVGAEYFDQAALSGHRRRTQDFDRIADLGIRTVRFGVLWEQHARDQSWCWTDTCMAALGRLRTQPIVGLMHHGSGPPDTSLLHPGFPEQLAVHALHVAERYPDVEAYTPVNEPNTTARFSGRYGLWYPHEHSVHSYLRALVNQARATVLSMAAIRRVRPDARLVQTDDAGSVTGTAEVRSTADLLHERQWLTYDLLFGRVDRGHPLFGYLVSHGIAEDEVLWFADHPCPPDVVGVNYYATSDRFLDHRRWLYPETYGSSEGPFVDVEAVRVEGCSAPDFAQPLAEAWQRYQRPVALTEVHLGGSVHEQIRWLGAAYSAMQRARQEGTPCEGVTAWAMLGSYFWNELVTRDNGHYEPGVFDVRSGEPVATELAGFVAALARDGVAEHPALHGEGWWVRPERFCYPRGSTGATRAA